MSYMTVIWPDGQDAMAIGPMSFALADALAERVEKEMHWHLNDPSSFAWAVKVRDIGDVDDIIAEFGAGRTDDLCPPECHDG